MGHSTLRFCGERRRRGRTCLSTPATLTRKLHKVVRLTDARSSDRRTRFAGWGLGGNQHGGGRSKVKAPLLAPPKLPPGQSAKHSSGSPAAVTRHWGRVAVGTARLFTARLSSVHPDEGGRVGRVSQTHPARRRRGAGLTWDGDAASGRAGEDTQPSSAEAAGRPEQRARPTAGLETPRRTPRGRQSGVCGK